MWGLQEGAASPSSHQPMAPRCSPTPQSSTHRWGEQLCFPVPAPPEAGSSSASTPRCVHGAGMCSVLTWPTNGAAHTAHPMGSPPPLADFPIPSVSVWVSGSSLHHSIHPTLGWLRQNRHGYGAKTAPPAAPLPKGHEHTKVVFSWFEIISLVLSTRQGLGPGMEATHPTAAALPQHISTLPVPGLCVIQRFYSHKTL